LRHAPLSLLLLTSATLAFAAPAPKPAAPPAPDLSAVRRTLEVGKAARVFEEEGNYSAALEQFRRLRGMQGPDADLELSMALAEARTGLVDSAWVRLHSPLLVAALADTAGLARRTEYAFQREAVWSNGLFDGWYWYVARARAELALQRGDWSEALAMATAAAEARPLSGKDALLLALAAGHAGDDALGEAAATWASWLDPSLPEAHQLRGLWAWRQGRRLEAREAFSAAALDTSWRDPVLAMARLALPGSRPDSLPRRFLTGARSVAMVTSAKRPKQEEFVQFDSPPMLLYNPQTQPPDSLRRAMNLKRRTPIYLQVFVSEGGRALVIDLPYVTEAQMPSGVVHHLVDQVSRWRFVAAKKFDRPQRAWASVEYLLEP
jgi:tetratricopeptide (TPR) repeat protein